MVTVKKKKKEKITFSKISVLKIVSDVSQHTIHFIDGTIDTFSMSPIDFAMYVTNKLV